MYRFVYKYMTYYDKLGTWIYMFTFVYFFIITMNNNTHTLVRKLNKKTNTTNISTKQTVQEITI